MRLKGSAAEMRYMTMETVVVKLGCSSRCRGRDHDLSRWYQKRGMTQTESAETIGSSLPIESFIHTWWLADRLVTYTGIIILGILFLRGYR